MARRSANVVRSKGGRQYHIGLTSKDVAPYVLLCGDPSRADRVAKRFSRVRVREQHREYVTRTGTYEGVPLTVLGTGIGPDNIEIAVVELAQLRRELTLIRIGSCGSLQPGIRIGDLVITTGAVRLENTSTFFVHEGYPAVADFGVVNALVESCREQRLRHFTGITATAPGFYGAQARRVPRFPPRFPDLPKQLARMNVLNFEMEISSLYTLASVGGLRAGAVCAVYAQRNHNRFADERERAQAEERVISAGLGAILRLNHE